MDSISSEHLVNNTFKEYKNEVDLIVRIRNADESAFEILYHLYYPRLFRFIARINRNQENIYEIINDVMYVVWKKASTYNEQCRPSTWIFGIAYNKARHFFASDNENVVQSLDSPELEYFDIEDSYSALQRLEMNNWLESALGTLSIEHRTVIELTYYEGLHYSEIAQLMNCPENTVKTRMHYAKKKLLAALESTH